MAIHRPNAKKRFEKHDGEEWFVIDSEHEGVHTFGRVVGGPMDGDSAERCAHEINDHEGNHRYVAAQKFTD